MVYDGPNEENEHLLEATLTVPSQYEIRSVYLQKYVGISFGKESTCWSGELEHFGAERSS